MPCMADPDDDVELLKVQLAKRPCANMAELPSGFDPMRIAFFVRDPLQLFFQNATVTYGTS